jgi:hypothetical protein
LGHGPTRTTTEVIFFHLWTFKKGIPRIPGAIAGLSGFVCSGLFCLWQKGNLFIALDNKYQMYKTIRPFEAQQRMGIFHRRQKV